MINGGYENPLRVHRPERDVRKHDDRRRSGATLEIVFDPRELFRAEDAEATRLAERVIANAPLSVAASKRVVLEQRGWSTEGSFRPFPDC